MHILLHQTDQKIADFESILEFLRSSLKKAQLETPSKDLILVFPELFLCGYPTQDLCLQKIFISNYLELLKQINLWLTEFTNSNQEKNWIILAGGLHYEFDSNGFPHQIYNSILKLAPGEKAKPIYDKMLLPNYDIFDEKKYFTAGENVKVLDFAGKKIALQICEDMWPSSTHEVNPIRKLLEQKVTLDAIINLSASPYNVGKQKVRVKRALEISGQFNCPFYYCNKVGGEDEIIFDGGSFIANDQQVVVQAKRFTKDIISSELLEGTLQTPFIVKKTQNTWENLFQVSLNTEQTPPIIQSLTTEQCEEIIQAVSFGIKEYAQKSGFKKILVALSGGLDSTVVLTIAKLLLKDQFELEAIYMPSKFSSSLSYELSEELCNNLNIPLRVFPIKFLHAAIKNQYKDVFRLDMEETLADENIQSRLRGTILYNHSNMTGSMVLNTSNKSEIAVGYSTLYGDSVGAISPLGDLFKSEVFDLAQYINSIFPNSIPQGIIDRPPTAELRKGQEDSQSLPPYQRLDALLECLLSYQFDLENLNKMGYDTSEVNKINGLVQKSEFKRFQFCPIIKIKAKSFGFGYRIPIIKCHAPFVSH